VRQWFAVSCVVEYRSSALPQIKITPNVRSSNSAYLIGPGAPWSNNEEGIFLIDFGAPPVHAGVEFNIHSARMRERRCFQLRCSWSRQEGPQPEGISNVKKAGRGGKRAGDVRTLSFVP